MDFTVFSTGNWINVVFVYCIISFRSMSGVRMNMLNGCILPLETHIQTLSAPFLSFNFFLIFLFQCRSYFIFVFFFYKYCLFSSPHSNFGASQNRKQIANCLFVDTSHFRGSIFPLEKILFKKKKSTTTKQSRQFIKSAWCLSR